MSEQLIKITLTNSSNPNEIKTKTVTLRPLKISHSEQAAESVAGRSNGDANLMQVLMQKALFKLLLFQIDDKTVSANDKEQMDNLFSPKEYGQLLKVVAKINGGDEKEADPKIEFVSSGDKQPG